MFRLFFVLALGGFLASSFLIGRSQDKSAGQVTDLFVCNSEKLKVLTVDVIEMCIFVNYRLVDPPNKTTVRRCHKLVAVKMVSQ